MDKKMITLTIITIVVAIRGMVVALKQFEVYPRTICFVAIACKYLLY